jgi:hypothetical protein
MIEFSLGSVVGPAAGKFAVQCASRWWLDQRKREDLSNAYRQSAEEIINLCVQEGYPARSPAWNSVVSLLRSEERAGQIALWFTQGPASYEDLQDMIGDDLIVGHFIKKFIMRLNDRCAVLLPPDLANLLGILSRQQGLLFRTSWASPSGDVCSMPVSGNDVEKRKEPCVKLVVDRVSPYRTTKSAQLVVYGSVKLSDGTTAFGEGLQIQLTLENKSDVEVVVPLIDVIISDYDPHPIEAFKYSTLPTSGTHLEVPGSILAKPIELTELDVAGSSVPVTQGRLFLRAAPSMESQHTLNFSLVARAPGIWRVQVQAEFIDAEQLSHTQSVQSDTLCIVKN